MAPDSTPWFKQWFDQNYLLLYSHRDDEDARQQVRLVIDTLQPPGRGSILDLGCGEGRYTFLFKNLGYRCFGLDLSESLVRSGRRKYGDLNLVIADMRAIPGRFDLVISMFTSFGYFEGPGENERVLTSVSGALHPGGFFWLDFLNPQYVRKNLVEESVNRVSSRVLVRERRKIENRRIVKDIEFVDGDEIKPYRESVFLFSREELEAMFERANLRVMGAFGNYHGDPWREGSERTILYARKEG